MRIIVGFALMVAVSAVLASAVVWLLDPQVQQATDALRYLSDHWPR